MDVERIINVEVTRKMDAVVHEKVMGVHPARIDDCCTPHYSTDIADAWKVVEKMKAHGFSWWFSDCASAESASTEAVHTHFASAAIRKNCCSETISMGQSPTMPMAICLVALKVIDQREMY